MTLIPWSWWDVWPPLLSTNIVDVLWPKFWLLTQTVLTVVPTSNFQIWEQWHAKQHWSPFVANSVIASRSHGSVPGVGGNVHVAGCPESTSWKGKVNWFGWMQLDMCNNIFSYGTWIWTTSPPPKITITISYSPFCNFPCHQCWATCHQWRN